MAIYDQCYQVVTMQFNAEHITTTNFQRMHCPTRGVSKMMSVWPEG